jgi:(p)ppGpp synthase/HD superfamily hydrolase
VISLRVNEAMMFCVKRHNGQLDKAGHPYHLHPIRVAFGLEASLVLRREDAQVVALLHDVVEDTKTTLEELEELFGPFVAMQVEVLTRRKDEPYFDYINRCDAWELTRAVKLADLYDNLRMDRGHDLSKEQRAKYQTAATRLKKRELWV